MFGFGLECLKKHVEHTKNPNKAATRMYKDYLKGILNIHKVHEASIYGWKKIMPHIQGGDGNPNLLLHFPKV